MGTVTDASVQRWYRPDRPAYRGVYTQQFEDDLDRYAELVAELAPPFIAEIGRAEGGTTLLLSDALHDANELGVVISIDIEPPTRMPLGRSQIVYITADSISDQALAAVRRAAVAGRGLILLDGDHTPAQVSRELTLYAPLASYLVVEDTIMRHLGDQVGPHTALDAWRPLHPEFVPDPDPPTTQHPGGWLRRI